MKKATLQKDHFILAEIEPLTVNQRKVWDSDKNLVLSGSAGSGKAQPGYSKVLLDSGWSTMEDVDVGDIIITPTGSKSKITGKFYNPKKEVYRIIFYDGRQVDCCEDHLWEIYEGRNLKNTKGKVLPLKYLLDKSMESRYYISLNEPIQYPSNYNLPIDPYVLGFLLGDGSLTENRVVFSTADSFIVDKINCLVGDNLSVLKIPSSKYEYSITTPAGQTNPLLDSLRNLGIIGCKSYDKFIPDIYMRLNIEDRLKLIQGLLDSDGFADGSRNSIEYSTTSPYLRDQFAELIYSLGGYCSVSSRMGSYKDKYGDKKETIINYRLIPSRLPWEFKKNLVSLPRKVNNIRPGQYDDVRFLRIKSIEYVGNMDCWCISIDSEQKLYLTDNFVVTHNTFLACYLALDDIFKKEYSKLVIIRSAVSTRDIGFLPGSEKDKMESYESPYIGIFTELLGRGDAYSILKSKGHVEFKPTSFIRGITITDSIIIVDEIQNLTAHELDSVITRVGDNCRIIFCGDFKQSDLGKNGMQQFMNILRNMNEFDMVEFTTDDIVRSGLVKNYLIAKEEYESRTIK